MPEPNCVCKTCGKPFYCKPSLIRLRNGGQHYSRACKHSDRDAYRRGEAHHSFKGASALPASGRNRAQRAYEVGDCERCGASASDRHHRDADTNNNAPENIAQLCRRCHMEVDGRLDALAGRNARPEARETAHILLEQGHGPTAIARQVGVSVTTVKRWRRQTRAA